MWIIPNPERTPPFELEPLPTTNYELPSAMFEKLPTAWLQLRYQKVRLLVALSGVIFAVVIIFMQLGIRDALYDSAVRFHQSLVGECFIISPRSTSLIAMESFSERRLQQALAFPEVEYVSPIYTDFAQWKNPDRPDYWRNIFVIGFDIRYPAFNLPGVEDQLETLALRDRVLFDGDSRAEFGAIAEALPMQNSLTTEVSFGGIIRQVHVAGLFRLGTSFGSDGNVLTSHLNFLRIFSSRSPRFIDLGAIKLKPGTSAVQFQEKLARVLPADAKVLTKAELVRFEKHYWQTATPIGFIFNISVFLGVLVGAVVVYQILYTNVSEHLAQYATLKAIGYRHRYLLSMVLQQAIFISIMGYIPGFLFSVIQYEFTAEATGLPIAMNSSRISLVFSLTLSMCFISGAIAMQKLKAADPADIF